MIRYKTQKRTLFSEVIHLYTEFGYSISHISLIFSLSYGALNTGYLFFQKKTKNLIYRIKKESDKRLH